MTAQFLPRELRLRRLLNVLLPLGALALYLLTLSRGAYPEQSAALLAGHGGLSGLPPLSNPLFGLLTRTVFAVSGSRAVTVMNLLAAVMAALAVALFMHVSCRWPLPPLPQRHRGRQAVLRARTVGAAVGALLLALSAPFWFAATRAHTASLTTPLFLLGVLLAQRAAARGTTGAVALCALFWGLLVTEYETAILWVPVVVLVLLWVLAIKRRLSPRLAATAAAMFALGLGVYLWQALWFRALPAYEWRGFDGLGAVIRQIWGGQYQALRAGLGVNGWLVTGLETLVPAVTLFLLPLSHDHDVSVRRGSLFLLAVLCAVGGAMLLYAPPTPWPLAGARPLLVMPYLLFAAWGGRLALYIMLLTKPADVRSRAGFSGAIRKFLRPAITAGLGLLLLISAVRAFSFVNPGPGLAADRLAKSVIDDLDGRRWLITDGVLDANIMLAAHGAGREVETVNTRLAAYRPYLRRLADQFDDRRLRGMARLGLLPLLAEWQDRGEAAAGEVAVFSDPDLWIGAGLEAVPRGVVFLGVRQPADIDWDRLEARHDELWRSWGSKTGSASADNVGAGWEDWSYRHISRMVNNYGVLLQRRGDEDRAYRVYGRSALLYGGNLSALLNRHALAAKEERPELPELRETVDRKIAAQSGRVTLWSLSRLFGYIHHPEAYAQRGYGWAMSGKPRAALREMEEDARFRRRPKSAAAMAALYFRSGQPERSDRAFADILAEDPQNTAALRGLARNAIRQGDFERARHWLERLRAAGIPDSRLLQDEVLIATLEGDYRRALELLEDWVERQPENLQAWSGLALAGLQSGNDSAVERAVSRLEARQPLPPFAVMTLASVAEWRGDGERALELLRDALRRQPGNVSVLENMLRLAVRLGHAEQAEEFIELILGRRPRHPFANHILGALQAERGDYALAEESLRVALAGIRSAAVLNDLAWVLYRRDKGDEALPLAEEALALAPHNPDVLDTLGVLLLERGETQAAEEALQRALAASPDNPVIQYHMALVQEKRGREPAALQTVKALLDRAPELDADTYERVRELMLRLRAD